MSDLSLHVCMTHSAIMYRLEVSRNHHNNSQAARKLSEEVRLPEVE